MSIDTINMNYNQSSDNSTRPATKQDNRPNKNKSLRELMQDKNLMN